jgi:hypothetical protein
LLAVCAILRVLEPFAGHELFPTLIAIDFVLIASRNEKKCEKVSVIPLDVHVHDSITHHMMRIN